MLLRHRAVRMLAPVLMTGIALTITLGPVNAAVASKLQVRPAASSTQSGKLPPGVKVSATSGHVATPANAGGDPCFTSWTQVTYSSLGLAQFWIRMTTKWCENGLTVTSHSTSVTQDHGVRWNYYPGSVSFNCYVAAGSARSCSGNHEHLTGANYLNGDLNITCFPSIAEWENYKGQYLSDWSDDCYPV